MRYFEGTWVWILAGMMFLISSCNPDETDPGIVVDVPLTFEVDLFETLDTLQNKLQFLAYTIEIQENCINDTIDFTLERREGKISVSLNDIQPAADCIEGEGPATATVPIGFLIPGQYDVEINLRNTVVNTGTLLVDEEYFYLNMYTIDGIKLLHQQLYRIPEDAVWGYLGYSDPGLETAAQAFISEMSDFVSPFDYPVGYYGHFRLNSAGNIELISTPATPLYNEIVYLLEDEREQLESLIETYRDSYPDLQIRIFDGKGVML